MKWNNEKLNLFFNSWNLLILNLTIKFKTVLTKGENTLNFNNACYI